MKSIGARPIQAHRAPNAGKYIEEAKKHPPSNTHPLTACNEKALAWNHSSCFSFYVQTIIWLSSHYKPSLIVELLFNVQDKDLTITGDIATFRSND